MTRPGIEPRSPGPLANTLTAGPYVYIYKEREREREREREGGCKWCNGYRVKK